VEDMLLTLLLFVIIFVVNCYFWWLFIKSENKKEHIGVFAFALFFTIILVILILRIIFNLI